MGFRYCSCSHFCHGRRRHWRWWCPSAICKRPGSVITFSICKKLLRQVLLLATSGLGTFPYACTIHAFLSLHCNLPIVAASEQLIGYVQPSQQSLLLPSPTSRLRMCMCQVDQHQQVLLTVHQNCCDELQTAAEDLPVAGKNRWHCLDLCHAL